MKKQIEDILLSETSFDEIIKKKMEEEIAQEAKSQKDKEKKLVSDIKLVPKDLIFSKYSTFRVFNRVNKTQSLINGLQAEALLGLQKSVYEKLKNAEIDAFSTENEYVKFENTKISA